VTASRSLRPSRPFDLRSTLSPLRHGRGDPTVRLGGRSQPELWRATRTPGGPATTCLTVEPADRSVTLQAWGPGADWCLDGLPGLIGEGAGDGALSGHPVVDELARRFPGTRIGRSRAVFEALVPAVLEQKVIGLDAFRSYAALVRRLGEPAPGPVPPDGRPLVLPPAPAAWAAAPVWVFHRCGVERKRADTVRRAAGYAARFEELVALPLAAARPRLTALPGIGPWTAAEVARVALGDVDAVSVGDYHLPHQVAWALAGEPRADDARMLELLAPWVGQRARVVRLVEIGAPTPPRYGPRLPLSRIAAL